MLAVWLASAAAGMALIVLLPEGLLGDGRLFSLSAGHGPSASDAIGVAVILAGWAWFVREVWRAWRGRAMRRSGLALAAIALTALALCLAAIAVDRNAMALLAGAIAVAAQIGLALLPHCHDGKERK